MTDLETDTRTMRNHFSRAVGDEPWADPIFDAWLTRVRADAARTALTDCADQMDGYILTDPQGEIHMWRDEHYPEGETS